MNQKSKKQKEEDSENDSYWIRNKPKRNKAATLQRKATDTSVKDRNKKEPPTDTEHQPNFNAEKENDRFNEKLKNSQTSTVKDESQT